MIRPALVQPFRIPYRGPLTDGVEPARAQWMAARQTAQPHPDSFPTSVALDRLAHVVRTRRVEAAGGGQQRRDTNLVYAQNPDQDPSQRRKRRSTSARSSGKGAFSAFLRGLMTMDHCGFNRSRCKRTASRTLRLIRLRTTALPRARGTVNPIRGPSAASDRSRNAAKSGPECRAPWS
jgi:hypothetical protein